jgi:hypothetical protein
MKKLNKFLREQKNKIPSNYCVITLSELIIQLPSIFYLFLYVGLPACNVLCASNSVCVDRFKYEHI